MAIGPGPQQRFPSRIVRISFPRPGGLVYFFWRYNYGIIRDPAAGAPPTARIGTTPNPMVEPYDAEFDFTDSELELSNFRMFADAPYQLLGKNLPNSILNADPPISVVNPVTLAMLKKYAIFSPATGVYDLSIDTVVTGFDTIVVDTAQWTEIYNNVVTYRLTPVWTRDYALNHFKTDGLLPGQDPDLVGVALTDVFGNLLTVPSPLFYAMAAEAGWTFHTEPSGTSHAYGRESGTGMIFNIGLLKAYLKSSERGAQDIHFKVNFARQRDLQAMEFTAQTFETGQRLNFPVNEKKRPQWDDWFPTTEITGGFEDPTLGFLLTNPERQRRTANVTLKLPRRNAQGNRVPLQIEIALDSSSGGGEEG